MIAKPRTALILAGGQATRMGGQDKGEVILAERRLVDHVTQRLKAQNCDILISGPQDYGLGVTMIPDCDGGPKGPAAGLYAASLYLKDTQADLAGFFTVPVDSPAFPNDLCERLYALNHSTIASDDNGLHPVFGWWRQVDLLRLWPHLDMSNSLSLTALAQHIHAQNSQWSGQNLFFNINTPNDMAKAAIMLDPSKKRR